MSTKQNIQNIRCAIYTRKSSEEGLEQDFNSLHAQREACAAYIVSQKHEGWQLVKTQYDDGGISGGTMERPALQQLLADIKNRRIDIIVVYKVDRLTRSLADFARMVELFDAHQVSFVSVTQQFNTTSSMGRLTLNVLLSFAQFEREVTGERIRDKIAASKQKGMWMGGNVPLGYEVKDRKLLIHKAAAETARSIFRYYLESGCVRLLQKELIRLGIHSKSGKILPRGNLYKMLSNPIYIGQIRHKGTCYPGQHKAIIAQELWNQVQQKIADNRIGNITRTRRTEPCPLTGKLCDVSGERLVPVHANKKGRRYRYYVSHTLAHGTKEESISGWRLPGQEIEQAVTQAAMQILNDQIAITHALQTSGIASHRISSILNAIQKLQSDAQTHALASPNINASTTNIIDRFVHRVELHPEGLNVTVSLASLVASGNKGNAVATARHKRNTEDQMAANPSHPTITQNIPMRMKRRGIEMRLIIDGSRQNTAPSRTDPTLIKTIIRAHKWFHALASTRMHSTTAIAEQEGVDKSYVNRVIPLAFLAPDITESILAGKQPVELNVEKLTKQIDIPLDWKEQHRILGFA